MAGVCMITDSVHFFFLKSLFEATSKKGRFISSSLTYHFAYQFYSRMIVLVQLSFDTTWASLFRIELEPNSLDWNGNELEHELEHELENMKRT